jgi:hypothetical protein
LPIDAARFAIAELLTHRMNFESVFVGAHIKPPPRRSLSGRFGDRLPLRANSAYAKECYASMYILNAQQIDCSVVASNATPDEKAAESRASRGARPIYHPFIISGSCLICSCVLLTE